MPKQQPTEKEIKETLKNIGKQTSDYPEDLKEARRVTIVAEARRHKPDGGNDNDDCLDKLFQIALLAVTFGSLFFN